MGVLKPADMRGQLTDLDSLRKFITAGRAVITVRSCSTGQRYTYRFKHPRRGILLTTVGPLPLFVSLLTGSDNESSYTFLGTVFTQEDGSLVYRHSRKSRVSAQTAAVLGVSWLVAHLTAEHAGAVFTRAQIWHEGRCGRCGRRLTVPESISSGFGPECIQLMGGVA